MTEFLLAVVIGTILLIAMVVLGIFVGKRAAASKRGQWAAARGWVYEGFNDWTAHMPGQYRWKARETLEDSESSVPQLEFQASLERHEPFTLLIEPRTDTTRHIGALTTLDGLGSGDFAEQLIVHASDVARARAVVNEDWIALWNRWPQRVARRMYVHVNADVVTLKIPEQALKQESDEHHFLLLGDELTKRLARADQ